MVSDPHPVNDLNRIENSLQLNLPPLVLVFGHANLQIQISNNSLATTSDVISLGLTFWPAEEPVNRR